MKKFTLFCAVFFLCGIMGFSQTNLIAGWDGMDVNGGNCTPKEAGWINQDMDIYSIWGMINNGSGCRFRDYITGGNWISTDTFDDGTSVPSGYRQLMLRFDNDNYKNSIFAYPTQSLLPNTDYAFTFDFVLGGSATPPKTMYVGVSSTADGSMQIMGTKQAYTSSSSSTVWLHTEYDFTTDAAGGVYYITFDDGAPTNGYSAWFGIGDLMLKLSPAPLQAVIDEAQSIYVPTANGADDFADAIEAAKSKLDFTTITEMEDAIADLKAAIKIYTIANYVSDYIVNPSFESNTAANQTNIVGWTNNGMKTQNNDSFDPWKDGNIYVEQWVNNGTYLPNISIQQTLSDIPNGNYTLTVAAHSLQDGSPADGGSIFADSKELKVGDRGDYSLNFVVTSGSVTIGFKTVNAKSNWAACDNFRLSYYGVDLSAFKAELNKRIDYANALTGKMQNDVAGELSDALAAAGNVLTDDAATESDLVDAIANLNSAITAAESSIVVYASLKSAMDEANTEKDTYSDMPGIAAFEAAIAAASGVYDAGEADDAAVAKAIEALHAAYLALRLSGDLPADATFVIINPSFANNTTEGWTGAGTVNYHELEFYQLTFNTYQVLTGLPAGTYTLKAQGFERPKGNDAGAAYTAGTETIYAKLYASGSMGEYAVPFNSIYSETYSGAGNASGYVNNMEGAEIMFNNGLYEMTVANIVVGGDGKLTIGAKSDFQQGGYWALFSNFRLIYEDSSLEPIIDALQQQIDAAKTLLGEKMQNSVLADLNTAITNAEAAIANPSVTAVELSDDAALLTTAVAAAQSSIAAYASLNSAVEAASALYDKYGDLPGADAFKAAIDDASNMYDTGDADEAAIADVIEALQQATLAFLQSGEDFSDTIANPDFEESYYEFAKPSGDRAIYQPEGWTAEWTNGDVNDMTYVATEMDQDNLTWSSYDGNSYFTRQRWSGNGAIIGLSQVLPALPAGEYWLAFQGIAFGNNGDASGNAKVYVTGEDVSEEAAVTVEKVDPPSGWNSYSIFFTLENKQDVTIGLRSTKFADNFKAGYDHFTLYLLKETIIDGVKTISADDAVIRTEYYNLQGQRVIQPGETGFYVVKKVLASGAVSIEKVIYRKK